MIRRTFNSKRYFKVFDFQVSHGQLLIRSSKNDTHGDNIDIIFFGVKYLQLMTNLSNISIKTIDGTKSLINYDAVISYLDYESNNLFEVETSDGKFYIAASYFRVYENHLDFNQSSLGMNDFLGRENEIVDSPD